MANIPMTIDGLGVHPDNFEKIVILRIEDGEETTCLPFVIGQAEFDALTVKTQGGVSLTPLTHDLFVSIIAQLGGKIDYIIINDFKDGIFYARLILDVKGIKVELDCRPSDALNIASSAKASMYISNELMPRLISNSMSSTWRQKDDFKYLAATTVEDSGTFSTIRFS